MIIRRETLKAVLPAIGDDSRYRLDMVQIEPDGHVAATNGHVLLVAHDTSARDDADFPVAGLPAFKGNPEQAVLVPSAVVLKLIAAMPKKSTMPILASAQLTTNGDGGAVISATDLTAPCTVHLEAGGAQFPNYARIMPAEDRPALTVQLSVEVLETLCKAARALNSQGLRIVTLRVPTEPQHQGRKPGTTEPDGQIIGALGVSIKGDGIEVRGAALPCRI